MCYLSRDTHRSPIAVLFENEPNVALAEDAAQRFERDGKIYAEFGGIFPALTGPELEIVQPVGVAVVGAETVDAGFLDLEREHRHEKLPDHVNRRVRVLTDHCSLCVFIGLV